MNKLVLIGNGFDLSHGLKTKYIDFILWYLNNAVQTLIKDFIYSDSLIEASIHYRTEPPRDFKSINDFHEFRKLYSDIKFNYRFAFFESLLKRVDDPNWVDIESEYYLALIVLYKELEKGNIDRHEYIDKKVIDLNNCFNVIKEYLHEYLVIIENSSKSINSEIAKLFIDEFGQNRPNENGSILFLNFNYTSTIEMYSDVINHNNYKINYIHGKLNDKSNPIIFGYGDEMDTYYQRIERLNSNEFLKNFKSFGYFKTSNYQQFSRFLNSDTFRVYVLGHSCGISDRILINSIVEHNKCSSIKIYFYDKGNGDNDFFEKTQELSRHFKSETKGIMRNIIIPLSESMPLTKKK